MSSKMEILQPLANLNHRGESFIFLQQTVDLNVVVKSVIYFVSRSRQLKKNIFLTNSSFGRFIDETHIPAFIHVIYSVFSRSIK